MPITWTNSEAHFLTEYQGVEHKDPVTALERFAKCLDERDLNFDQFTFPIRDSHGHNMTIEHDGYDSARWINVDCTDTSGTPHTFSLGKIDPNDLDRVVIYNPVGWSVYNMLGGRSRLMLVAITKQLQVELIKHQTPAWIIREDSPKLEVAVEKFFWDSGDEHVDIGKATGNKKSHWQVPQLSTEELYAARKASKFQIIYTQYAENLKDILRKHINEPVFLEGAAGTGKSLLCQVLGEEAGKSVINRVTFTAKMDISMTLGNRYPTNMWLSPEGKVVHLTGAETDEDGNQINLDGYKFLGIGLSWRDGIVTKMARAKEDGGTGGMLVLDELPKAPPEFVNRLHEILEDEFPTMTIYENAEDQATVNDDLWVMATGNPVGGGYFNNTLDKALLDRMRVFKVNKPIADEEKIIEGLIPETYYGETGKRLIRTAQNLREDEETAISTRALVMVAKSLLRGVNPVSAFQINYFNTLSTDGADKAESVAQTHFVADWSEFGPVEKLGY